MDVGKEHLEGKRVEAEERVEGLTLLWSEFWHLIDVLTGISAVGDAESKIKIKGLEQPVSKVVSLYHSELLHWLIPHCELNPEKEEKEE